MIDVFIVFAPEDHALLVELEKHLQPLVLEELITIWHERKMMAGMDVEQESAKHWDTSSIILLLLSANFMAGACYKRGIEALEKSKAQKGIHVIPVLLKDVDWEQTKFSDLHPLPVNRKAITRWSDQNAACREVARGIRKIIAPARSAETAHTAPPSTVTVSKQVKEPSMPRNIEDKLFDVFISYNSKDRPEVKEIAQQLRDRGLRPWFDEWELRPGLSWQKALEKQIGQIHAAAIFVGKVGIGRWQGMEMNAYIRKFVEQGSPVIPVLLKDAPEEPPLPIFLEEAKYIDFRKSKQDVSPLDQLIWGITGHNPNDHEQEKKEDPIDEFASENAVVQMNISGLSFAKKSELVNKLLACPTVADRHARDMVVQQLSRQIPHAIARHAVDTVDVTNIVSTCLNFANGLQELVEVVGFYEKDSLPMQRLRAFVGGI